MSWSRYALLAGIVLALVLVIPTAWFPFQLSKVAVFAVALTVSALLFVLGGGARDLLRTHGVFLALTVLALPVVYLVSAVLSIDRSIAISGYSVETDTVLFVLLASLAFVLSFNLFRTLRTAKMLTTVVFWALVAAAIFQLVSIAFGSSVIPFDTFADRSVNLVGKWNDLGLLCALLGLLLLVRVELTGSVSVLWRVAGVVGGVLLVALLGLVNFLLAWALLLAGCVLIALLAVLRHRAAAREGEAMPTTAVSLIPWYSVAGVVVSVLFLLYGANFNASLTSVFPVSSLEVRPGLQSTLDVIGAAREGSPTRMLLGTGPSTFGMAWLAFKPAEVNQTPFWNLDFNVGYSTLATAFGTVGLLGALAWLVPLLLLMLALIRAVRVGALSREERLTASILCIGSLFLLATLALYVPSQNIILLAFMLSGATFGFLWRQGRSASEDTEPTVLQGVAVIAIAALMLVLAVLSSFSVSRRFVAQAYTGAGLYELSRGNVDQAQALAARAQGIERTADALRLATDAGAQKLARIAQDTSLSQEQARAAFTAQVESVIPTGQAAVAAAPHDYRPVYSLARVYDLLASLKIDGAYQSAQQSYLAAAELNPTSPTIPLALARLEASQGVASTTQAAITRALQLKPDYTDAILFVVQLNVANNDLASAIANTKIAVQTAPGVASIWFQLGLLYYAGGDTKSAIPPLEEAIRLVGDYANAKYFLALAYHAQGRTSETKVLFEQLSVSNPDNAEVKAILANLAAGKQPLDGLQPPPEDRPTAPVTQ